MDAGELDPWIAPALAAQSLYADHDGGPQPLLVRIRHTGGPTGPPDKRSAVVTENRVAAVLNTLTAEREIDFDHHVWAAEHGVHAMSV